MYSRVRTFIVAGCTVLACLGPGAHVGVAQEAPRVIESYFPTQLIPGQTNVLNVATGARNPIQSLEITPSTGIMVTGMKQRDLHQGSIWWEFTIAVAKDAAPGPRMLVAVQPTGRSAPVTLMIPSHVPSISNLRVLSGQVNQPTVDLQFAAVDPGGTFGDSPYVWFVLACAPAQPNRGVVRGKFADGAFRVGIPSPRTLVWRGATPAAGSHCDLEVRASDSSSTESNTLKTTVDFK